MAWYCVILRMKIMTVPWKNITKGLALSNDKGKQDLYFNEIVVYEKKLDFATAKEKAAEYVKNYPADEAGIRENNFLKTR